MFIPPPLPPLQVIGLALIGLAIYLLATQNDLTFLTGSRVASGAVLILISGLVTAIISFIGVLGAIGMWPVLLIVVSRGCGHIVQGCGQFGV